MTVIIAPAGAEHTPTPSLGDPLEGLTEAVQRQAATALAVVREHDPQAWLFMERARYVATGSCDPYAEQMLRQAGFL